MSYADIEQQFMMLRDEPRTAGYQAAIAEVVRPGQVVLDLGCGTGVLSVFAARAGARKVYAVERSRMVHVAERVAAANGLADRISFLAASSDEIVVPEPVDVLVSEWMGMFLFREKMFEAVVRLRDRALAPLGVMLPSHAALHGAFVGNEALYQERCFFRQRPYGVDYAPVADWLFGRTEVRAMAPDELCSRPFELGALDMKTCDASMPRLGATVRSESDMTAYGICGWFTCQLSPSVVLDTSPWAPLTHWKQMFFPFREPVRVATGQDVSVAIEPLRVGKDERESWKWSVTTGGPWLEHDDFMDHVWLETEAALAKRLGGAR